MQGILINVNLQGNLEGCVMHFSTQRNTVQLQKGKYVSNNILHTDRKETKCVRTIRISEEVANIWQSKEVPTWSNPRSWGKLSPKQRIQSHISSFDEGCGVSFEILE